MDVDTLQKRADWEVNVRRARGFTYQATVQGHEQTPDGPPWEPNLLVSVFDDFGLTRSDLIIKEVVYKLTLSGGTVTELDCVYPNSYLPEPDIAKKDKRNWQIGHLIHKKGKKGVTDAQRKLESFEAGD